MENTFKIIDQEGTVSILQPELAKFWFGTNWQEILESLAVDKLQGEVISRVGAADKFEIVV